MKFPAFSTVFGAILFLTSTLSADETTRKIVVFKNGVSETAKAAVLENLGAKVVKIKDISLINAIVINLPQDAAISLSANTAVDFIETDVYENWLEAVAENNFNELDGHQTEIQILPWGVNEIDAEKAWRKTSGKQKRLPLLTRVAVRIPTCESGAERAWLIIPIVIATTIIMALMSRESSRQSIMSSALSVLRQERDCMPLRF